MKNTIWLQMFLSAMMSNPPYSEPDAVVIKSWMPSRGYCIAHFQNSSICRDTIILSIINFRKKDLMRVTAKETNII